MKLRLSEPFEVCPVTLGIPYCDYMNCRFNPKRRKADELLKLLRKVKIKVDGKVIK